MGAWRNDSASGGSSSADAAEQQMIQPAVPSRAVAQGVTTAAVKNPAADSPTARPSRASPPSLSDGPDQA